MEIESLELIAAKGWRALEEAWLGDWLLRAAAGFTGRANSALAVGDPGLPLAEAVAAVRDWYERRGLPAMIAVPYSLPGPPAVSADRFLGTLGWGVRADPATVMIASSAAVARAFSGARADPGTGIVPAGQVGIDDVRIDARPDEAWLALYHYRGQPLPPIARRLLLSAPFQAFASVREGDRAVAIGRVAVADGWAGLTAIEVSPERRQSGLGTAVTAALARVAADRGAARLYLQVADGNAPALALYARCGFTASHGYRYRVEPGGPL